MDFQLTNEQRALQETARRYAHERLPDIARECEEIDHAPDQALVREFAELGFLGINVPEALRRPWPRQPRGAARARGVRQDLVRGRVSGLRILRRAGARDRAIRVRDRSGSVSCPPSAAARSSVAVSMSEPRGRLAR